MGALDNLKDKAQDLIEQHGDKIDSGLEKAAQMVDEKTGGKYHDKIAGGVDKAQEALDRMGGTATTDETESAGVQDLDGIAHDGSMRVADEGLGAPGISRESPAQT
jgi:hypothetical protein